ncbi:hypothetical protein AGDE_00083 [Angomonas deanei]|uniref:Uncharacterized protein n=1 Tax=Angomonas deanei TaxID=59799 RepID=S9VSC1_9TRYP|nr:hypothetical protein AGDE_05528 [Angomonas deanei]EPY43838.1 hypothetical protein AGDE_00083 [Angomonas deanei]CAD2220357.1 hypothetical protein, conserved [Angomonas deanei]|eukprot:EPY38401.1 hypothetical protein AGDE_05528 [Angomonas deanei]
MINSWEKFIVNKLKSNKGPPVRCFLLFVVDAIAPHNLCKAVMSLMSLKEKARGVCHSWPTLIALQKCAAPRSLTVGETRQLFLAPEYEETTRLIEVDSWNGIGLEDVAEWVREVTASA